MTLSPNVIDKILVSHTAFREAIDRVNESFEFAAKGSAEPICLAIIGESRTGKSRVLETCCLQHPSKRLDDGLVVPILKVKAPSKPTVKGIIEVMLDALGAPDSQRGTENEKSKRLRKLLKETGTVMLMIDEFQHFFDKGTKAVMHHVADWLKILVDEAKCALVVAGLPTCQAVIETNEQLGGRFLAPVVLPRFSWENAQHRREFKAILRSFYESLKCEVDMPQLHTDEMAFRFYCASGGLMGYVTKLLRQAIWHTIATAKGQITLADLDAAHRYAIWNSGGADALKPFRPDFQTLPDAELLKSVSRVGTGQVATEVPSRKRAPGAAKRSAAEALVTR